MERSRVINYKESSIKKINTYTWCGIVDKDGNMLLNHLISIPEYWEWFNELDNGSSQYLLDSQECNKGINNVLKTKFFKFVDAEIGTQFLQDTGREHGRFNPSANLYVYITMADALYTNELFSKGVLFLFTSLENLNDYLNVIDSIRILRINHSFKEIFPDEELELIKFDDIIRNDFIKNHESRLDSSTKYLDLLKNNKQPKHEDKFWDNGMKIVEKKQPKQKKSDVPLIYDYVIQEYKYQSRITTEKIAKQNVKVETKTFDKMQDLMR